MKSKNQIVRSVLLLACLAYAPITCAYSAAAGVPSDESDVRAAANRIFDQLKNGEYAALYDALPSSSRSRVSREQFASSLQRSRNLYQLDRIEIGNVRVSGNLAVVDTTMYARITKPFDAEGKLVAQQYLVREEGRWRVATGDKLTIDRFLKSNPGFARQFPIKRTRVYIKQDSKWVEFNMPARRR